MADLMTKEFLDMTFPDKYYKDVIEPAKTGKGPVPSKVQMLSKSQPFKAMKIGMNPAKYGAFRAAPTTAARTAIGSNVAFGLPFAYAGMAGLLQDRLEDQGLTGEGGIYDISGGWGAMGAGADIPIIQKMLADRRATQKGIADANMQRKIQEAEAAQAQAAAAQQVRQNIQTYGNRDRPNTGMNRPGGGRGQSPTGGDVSGTPFARGGLIDLYRYGGFI